MKCTICRSESSELEHLSLYVIGSEGISVCLECRMILTEVAKGMMLVASKSRMAGYKAAKTIANVKHNQIKE